jgi:type I restriction enzyme R subunit
MTPAGYTEETLVQQTTAQYLHNEMGWESVYAYNTETFGPEGTLGRASDREVVLTRYLYEKLIELNPGLPPEAYREAVRQITEYSVTQSSAAINADKYALFKEGVPVSFRNADGVLQRERLRVFDFGRPENNHFLIVRELWVRGDLYRRRADIVGFINGVPLLFMELKNLHKELRSAYEQNLADYLDTVPHLFHHNALIVLGNGVSAVMGSVTSRFDHYNEWKRLSEEEPGAVQMETLLKGVCNKSNFMDIFENFIVFDHSVNPTAKIVARNHQFLGVNRAVEAVDDRRQRQGKLGVFWHTQGSGKSYSMVFFTRKVRRKLGGNFTFLICTDRDDLDTQIYKTFAGCGLADNDKDPCRAHSGDNLVQLLHQHKAYVFTLIQKFNKEIGKGQNYSPRDDIIVITDEAHRTQYGTLSLNMRDALPNASYIGFTGTPLFTDDEITRRVFGDYVSTYDFQRAVEDNATVPLYYDARGEKLRFVGDDGKTHRVSAPKSLNEKIAKKLEALEIDDVDIQQRLERDLKRDYHIITADKRLNQVAQDFVMHYSTAWESGKAMLVCIDKVTCVRMCELINWHWAMRLRLVEASVQRAADAQEAAHLQRQAAWMRETRMAVVVSEEQGEVEKFRKWDLDILPVRRLAKEGMTIPASMRCKPEYQNMQRVDLDDAFKAREHPFRIAIVCAMWLTGFDVPSLSTLYLDKPLKAHTLMQAIARANRVDEGKNNGLVVDYCGVLKNLRKAMATFAGRSDEGHGGEEGSKTTDPAGPENDLLETLAEAVGLVRDFLEAKGASLSAVIEQEGFARNAAIEAAKDAANENDETRKRFELMCRQVFKKFKACINNKGVNDYRRDYNAVNIIYKSLQRDRELADITDIIRALHTVVDEAIAPEVDSSYEKGDPYDISRIDFDLLRREFAHQKAKKTMVQNLRQMVENRLSRMLAQNPLRTDFQQYYDEIVSAYNKEKDRPTIEATFEALLKMVEELDTEAQRAMREGLDEETLVLFDLLKKTDLNSREIKRIKQVAVELLQILKVQKLRIDNWRAREATRDDVRVTIRDFLWSDETGLPEKYYSEEEVTEKAEDVYRHIYRTYPAVPSPFYVCK